MAVNFTEFASVNHNATSSNFTPEAKDAERQEMQEALGSEKVSIFNTLGWLDRFLGVFIFFAMAIGIPLGNFVPSAGSVLQKGKFAGVSVPIGWSTLDCH